MHGWTGSVLRVDLSKGDYTIENLDLALAKKFVGRLGRPGEYQTITGAGSKGSLLGLVSAILGRAYIQSHTGHI